VRLGIIERILVIIIYTYIHIYITCGRLVRLGIIERILVIIIYTYVDIYITCGRLVRLGIIERILVLIIYTHIDIYITCGRLVRLGIMRVAALLEEEHAGAGCSRASSSSGVSICTFVRGKQVN
jgi:hypothetical protein